MRFFPFSLLFPVIVPLFGVSVAHAAVTEERVLDRVEASVNGKLILLSDLRTFRKTQKLRTQLDPLFQGTALAAVGDRATDSDITKFLVDERMILQAYPVADTEVDQEISSIVSNNHIDRNSLKQTLKEQGFSFDDYFDLIRIGISKRTLIDRDIRTKVSISDDDVKNFYQNTYGKSGERTQTFHVRLIHISPKTYKNATGARTAAELALATIKKGDSFAEVAKRFSDGPNAEEGGDLGSVSEDQMNPAIRAEVKKLHAGGVSPVFGNPKEGWLIAQLVDIVAGEDARLVRMKEDIRGQLAASEYQRQIGLWLDRQRQETVIHVTANTPKK